MIPALQQLTSGLNRVFAVPARHPETWFDSRGIELAKEQVIRDHGGASIAVDRRTIMASVEDFRRSGKAASFRELKYVCLGIGSMDARGWCLLSDERLRRAAIGLADGQEAVHRKLRCFQALLSAYLSFPLGQADANAEAGWRELRAWLHRQRLVLLGKLDNRPKWFDGLDRHSELLTDKPCDKFGPDLLRGDATGLNEARSSLAIEADSWVMEAAVLAQMKAAARLDDRRFKEALPSLVQIATGQAGVKVGDRLRVKCVALLVSRYSRAAATPEHPTLRDASVSVIGNPWLRKANWDAHVVLEDGSPDREAREMVFGWLKGRLIQDFFELLSAEGSGDRRRLAYWLRFAPFVDDMWFALGPYAQSRNDSSFREFRDRAKGRLLDLEATTSDNNAFVMRIGAYLAIEFGSKGNAFFLLEWDKLPKAVANALRSGRARESIDIFSLKPRVHVLKKSHMDAPTALKSWEQKFDDDLLPTLGVKPDERPACVPDLEKLLDGRDIVVADTRASGGSLKLTPDERLAPIARQLSALGMVRRSTRGWFKE
jgi:hypothetical protein